MIYDLVPEDDPILQKRLDNFNVAEPPIDPRELANNLIETMVEYNGLGISANQCGLPYRVFVMRSIEPLVVINPRIVDTSTNEVLMEEGCISFPNLILKIKRPEKIRVRYVTLKEFEPMQLETITETFHGMSARVFQHELDHLNGIDYRTRANSIHLDRGMRKRKRLERQSRSL